VETFVHGYVRRREEGGERTTMMDGLLVLFFLYNRIDT